MYVDVRREEGSVGSVGWSVGSSVGSVGVWDGS